MAKAETLGIKRVGRIQDARGRRVHQLDPVAMYLLRRFDLIGVEDLRDIAMEIDAGEVRKRPLAALRAPILVVLWYTLFFAYFHFFSTWKGWDPVLIGFAILYFLFPFWQVYRGFRKARDLSGLTEKDLAKKLSTRRSQSLLGKATEVSSRTTAEQWLKRQPVRIQVKMLGKGRAELFRTGKIGIKDLVRDDLTSVSLADLRKKVGG